MNSQTREQTNSQRTINLEIGPEDKPRNMPEDFPKASRHLVNLKSADSAKKEAAHKKVSLDLKDEIKNEHKKSGRICIVGELPRSKQGLGRAPMILAAFLVVLLLSASQIMFLGKKEGGEALALASEAFLSLQGASESFLSGDSEDDMTLFTDAEELFREAEEKSGFLLNHKSDWLMEPMQVTSLRNILDAGELMAEVGQHMTEAKDQLAELPEEGSLTDYIRMLSETHLEPAAEKLDKIESLLDETDMSGTGYEEKFFDYSQKLTAVSDIFDLWVEAKEPILTALGDRYPQHYMILLMNNDEMRVGGGFIGSFALVELNDGHLTDMSFHDVYEFDNSYHEVLENPMHEIRHLAENWRLRDSNISADFTVSAEEAIHFLDVEGGPGVDGVIAVNLSAAEALIAALGGLDIPSLGASIDAESFSVVLSTLVESKTFGMSSPKDILADVIESFMAASSSMDVKAKLGLVLLDQISSKQVMLYHRDKGVKDLLSSLGMDASVPDMNELTDSEIDFFLPTFTNTGANKTDRYMETNIKHETQILSDGTIVDAATITRTHTFNSATMAWLKSTLADYGFTAWNSDLEAIAGNSINKTGIRLYLPADAQILEVSGDAYRDDLQFYYDSYEDIAYYYLDQEVSTDSTKSFTVTYALPWKFQGDFQEYNFEIFKQPGLKNTTYRKTVSAPDDIMLSSEPIASEFTENTDYILSGEFNGDKSGVVLYR